MPYKEGKQWRGTVRVKLPSGKLHRATKIFSRKRDASQWEADEKARALAEYEALNQQLKARRSMTIETIGRLAKEYEEYSRMHHTRGVANRKARAMLSLVDFLGGPDVPISEVTSIVAMHQLGSRFKKAGASAANHDRKELRAMWSWGTKYHKLSKDNPFDDVDRFPETPSVRPTPTLQELQSVMDAATLEQRYFLQTLFLTAARKSEVLNIRREDVDLENRTLALYTRKSGDGSLRRDVITISEKLVPAFQALLHDGSGQEMLFKSHKRFQHDGVNTWLKMLCCKTGVKPFHLHGIRHLAASVVMKNGTSLVEAQGLLRHQSLRVTEQYVRNLRTNNRAYSVLDNALDDVLQNTGS